MSPPRTVEEIFSYFEGFTNLERGGYHPREYRLERMAELLDRFGNPQQAYDIVHVAGSKGKGSVCAFAAHILAASGRKVGMYTSPHVSSYRERIMVYGPEASEEERDGLIVRVGGRVHDYVQALGESESAAKLPTTFELLTLLALLIFREAGCSASVIEVGLGGRLDATNLVTPNVSVITRIELEHTDYLGPDLPSIAREKAGIIKPGRPVITAPQLDVVRAALESAAQAVGSPMLCVSDVAEISVGTTTETGTRVSIRFADGVHVGSAVRLLGRVQAINAAVAALAVRTAFGGIESGTISAGLEAAWLPGRAELLPGPPRVLLDGAHTPESIAAVLDVAGELEPNPRRRVLIFGSVRGKDYRRMLALCVGVFSTVLISRPGTFKESSTAELLEACIQLGGNCARCDDIDAALDAARIENPALVVVTGSFYLIGEARRALLAARTD